MRLAPLPLLALLACSPSCAAPPAASGHPPDRVDRGAIAMALGSVVISGCLSADGVRGSGHASITFDPDGSVIKVVVDYPPFAGTPTGDCIAHLFERVHIPPFPAGPPVRVGKSFYL